MTSTFTYKFAFRYISETENTRMPNMMIYGQALKRYVTRTAKCLEE